jgi:penicillin-binding protein 1A
MNHLPYFLRRGLWALLSLSFLLIMCGGLVYIYLVSQLPGVESLKTVQLEVPLQIYTQDGLLIQEYGEKKRIPLTYEKIPHLMVQALLVTEDQRFFDHPGVDVFGLMRATVRMIQTGTKSQGGSTITMQVARNFFLNRKKTFLRKFNEIMLAIKIDRELSKEKILELYLNKIYLGSRAYGVEAAAQVYYGKSITQLNLAQIAMLAGLPQAPSSQNPITNPTAAKIRRNHVLDRLLEEKIISKTQHDEATQEPITAYYHNTNLGAHAPYVAEMIRQSLYDQFGADAYTKGYKVYSTINSELQNTANKVIEEHLLTYDHHHGYRGPIDHLQTPANSTLASYKKQLRNYPAPNDLQPAIVTAVSLHEAQAITQQGEHVTIPWSGLSWARPALKKGWMGKTPSTAAQVVHVGDVIYVIPHDQHWQLTQIPLIESALVALNPHDGAIKALVGGFNFPHSKFNRATQSARQPGSSFKPFLYAAALNKGYSLATLINDAPIAVDDTSQVNMWRPHNVDHTFGGPTRLKEALIRSRNLVSIRILDDIGIDYTIDFSSQFGFPKQNLPRGLSLALGSMAVSPMELATGYAVFANGGYRIEPYLIDHITDYEGQVIQQTKPQDPPRVIAEDVAFLMNTALQDVIQKGTAQDAKVLNRTDLAGKTGTTNDQVDAWFAGYMPDLVVTTWVGFDTPTPLHEYAAKLALPIWIDFMRVALKQYPEHFLKQPTNVIAVHINPRTGLREENQGQGILEYFRDNEIPGEREVSPTEDSSQESLF